MQILPLAGPEEHKHRGDTVRQNVGHHIARDPHGEHRQQQDVEHDGQRRAQNPVQGKESHMAHGPRKLVADRMDVGHQHIKQHQPHITGEERNLSQQRRRQEQNQKTGQIGQNPGGKDLALVGVPVQSIPNHRVCHPDGRQGDDQIAGLKQQVGHAVFRAGEDAGIKGRQEKGQKTGSKGAEPEQGGIGDKLLIGVHEQDLPGIFVPSALHRLVPAVQSRRPRHRPCRRPPRPTGQISLRRPGRCGGKRCCA